MSQEILKNTSREITPKNELFSEQEVILNLEQELNSAETIPEYLVDSVRNLGGDEEILERENQKTKTILENIRSNFKNNLAKIFGVASLLGVLNIQGDYNLPNSETEIRQEKIKDSIRTLVIKQLHLNEGIESEKLKYNLSQLFTGEQISDIHDLLNYYNNNNKFIAEDIHTSLIDTTLGKVFLNEQVISNLQFIDENIKLDPLKTILLLSDASKNTNHFIYNNNFQEKYSETLKSFSRLGIKNTGAIDFFTTQISNHTALATFSILENSTFEYQNEHPSYNDNLYQVLPDKEEDIKKIYQNLKTQHIHFDQTLHGHIQNTLDHLQVNISGDSLDSYAAYIKTNRSRDLQILEIIRSDYLSSFSKIFNKENPLSGKIFELILKDPKASQYLSIHQDELVVFLENISGQHFLFEDFIEYHSTHNNLQKLSPDYLQAFTAIYKIANFPTQTIERKKFIQVIDQIISLHSNGTIIDVQTIQNILVGKNISLNEFNDYCDKQHVFNRVGPVIDNIKNIYLSGQEALEFSYDKSLTIIKNLNLYNNPPRLLQNMNSYSRSEYLLRTARTMYLSNISPTRDNFDNVLRNIIEIRENKELKDKQLFTNRNVVVFAHNELLTGAELLNNKDNERFGNQKLMHALEKQNPKEIEYIKSKDDMLSLRQKSQQFLSYIEQHKDLTVIINAHGSPDGIFLTDGIPDKNGELDSAYKDQTNISTDELVDALLKRYQNDIYDVPIFIFSSCFNQNYIRTIIEKIQKINNEKGINILIPIMIGSAEYGQYGFSNYDHATRDPFLDALLINKPSTTINDILHIEDNQKKLGIPSNVSVFIPIKKDGSKITVNKVMQIAENNENSTDIPQSDLTSKEKSVT